MILNERAIKAANPGDVLRDPSVKGLHLRAFAERSTFYLYYRTKSGTERRPKLGDYGTITLTQARDMAKKWLAEVAEGKDPAAALKVKIEAPTMADLWVQYWDNHGKKKKSAKEDADIYRRHIQPRFGKKKLADISYSDVSAMVVAMEKTPVSANRTLSLLSKMFNFAHRPLEWTDKNPVKGVARYKEEGRRRYMEGEEAHKIAEILHKESANHPASVAFIYLLILTGARSGEIAGAKWSWVKGDVIELPDSKTGKKTVHLPPQALEVMDRLPKTSGTITGIKSPKRLWDKVRAEVGCHDLRIHDLRHSFASAALAAGLSLTEIGELLGHKSAQTTKRYAHLVKDAGVAAATKAADRIASQMRVNIFA
jgi:integrase